MRFASRTLLGSALAATILATGAPAQAATGGTTAPPAGTGAPPAGTGANANAGGTTSGSVTSEPRAESDGTKSRSRATRPALTSFSVAGASFYDLGRPARIAFRIDGRGATVRVKLQIRRGGKLIRTIDLGDRATGRAHAVELTGREGGRLPQGTLQLRLSARDRSGRGLSASSSASATDTLGFYWHRFPLVGRFDYGGEDARFGADRPGHVHQGQDLTAAEGTPVVAPRAGVVKTVAYQAGGAGHYVVLAGEGENRSYVFMHLREGSIRVGEGNHIRTGERLADVGSTGASSGPHLHFEIWDGPWYAGGHAIDPLPDLQRWDRWS
jgi:murein DD-endopeptidase MepM/ murein hydrolase activator NlpD